MDHIHNRYGPDAVSYLMFCIIPSTGITIDYIFMAHCGFKDLDIDLGRGHDQFCQGQGIASFLMYSAQCIGMVQLGGIKDAYLTTNEINKWFYILSGFDEAPRHVLQDDVFAPL